MIMIMIYAGESESSLTESIDISLSSSPIRREKSSKFSTLSMLMLRLWNLERLERNYCHNNNNGKSSAWT